MELGAGATPLPSPYPSSSPPARPACRPSGFSGSPFRMHVAGFALAAPDPQCPSPNKSLCGSGPRLAPQRPHSGPICVAASTANWARSGHMQDPTVRPGRLCKERRTGSGSAESGREEKGKWPPAVTYIAPTRCACGRRRRVRSYLYRAALAPWSHSQPLS